MDKEYAKLISDIFILKKNKEDLSYSSATYYNKLRRATKQFLKLTNND
jgi:hypothetical protein